MPDAAEDDSKDGKRRDPWHDAAQKLSAQELPAHLRHQLQEALAAQVKVAAGEFEATAKTVVDKARA